MRYCSRKLMNSVIFKKLNKSKQEIGHKTGSLISAVKLCGRNLRKRMRNTCAKFKKVSFVKMKSLGFENAGTGVFQASYGSGDSLGVKSIFWFSRTF